VGIHRSPVSRIIRKDLCLKCCKERRAQQLTEANSKARLLRLCLLLDKFSDNDSDFHLLHGQEGVSCCFASQHAEWSSFMSRAMSTSVKSLLHGCYVVGQFFPSRWWFQLPSQSWAVWSCYLLNLAWKWMATDSASQASRSRQRVCVPARHCTCTPGTWDCPAPAAADTRVHLARSVAAKPSRSEPGPLQTTSGLFQDVIDNKKDQQWQVW